MLNRLIQILYLIGVIGSGAVVAITLCVILINPDYLKADHLELILLGTLGPILVGWGIKFIVTGNKSWKPRLGDQ